MSLRKKQYIWLFLAILSVISLVARTPSPFISQCQHLYCCTKPYTVLLLLGYFSNVCVCSTSRRHETTLQSIHLCTVLRFTELNTLHCIMHTALN